MRPPALAVSVAASGPPWMTVFVRIEHSADTLMSRSSGLEVLNVAVSRVSLLPGPMTAVFEAAATALLAGWALLDPIAAGTATAMVAARPAAMTARGEKLGIGDPPIGAQGGTTVGSQWDLSRSPGNSVRSAISLLPAWRT